MRARGVPPNLIVCNCLLRVYGRARMWGECDRVQGVMAGLGLVPDAITFNTLIVASGAAGEQGRALEHVERMKAAGCRPNDRTLFCLEEAFGDIGTAAAVALAIQEAADVRERTRAQAVV